MTNVPDNIRSAWTDLYKFFDYCYAMPNTIESWDEFWKMGIKIIQKYNYNKRLTSAVFLVGEVIEDRMRAEWEIPG